MKGRFLSFVLVLLVVLAGCGSDAGVEEKTEIDFWFPVAVGGDVANIVDGIVEDFEKENPNIKVNAKYGGSYAETMTQVMASAQGGNPPELAVLFSIDLFTLLENDLIEELTPLFEDDYLNDFYDGFMANSSISDKVYSLPFQRKDDCPILQQGRLQRGWAGSGSST